MQKDYNFYEGERVLRPIDKPMQYPMLDKGYCFLCLIIIIINLIYSVFVAILSMFLGCRLCDKECVCNTEQPDTIVSNEQAAADSVTHAAGLSIRRS